MMNSPAPLILADTCARVHDRRHLGGRPVFECRLQIMQQAEQQFAASRSWQAVAAAQPVAVERLSWSAEQGLLQASSEQAHLQESASLLVTDGAARSQLQSIRTGYQPHEKLLHLPRPPLTLLSVLFDIARHWPVLMAGKSLHFAYVVLKVQAQTGVSLRMRQQDGANVVQLMPDSYFWRLVFGATLFRFADNTPLLTGIDGLLEPRDLNRRGKYIEYLGRMDFASALDLTFVREVSHG